MAEPPAGSLPISFNSSFPVDNSLLQKAEYILTDKVTGVETVAVSPDGRLGLVDRFGKVNELSKGDYGWLTVWPLVLPFDGNTGTTRAAYVFVNVCVNMHMQCTGWVGVGVGGLDHAADLHLKRQQPATTRAVPVSQSHLGEGVSCMQHQHYHHRHQQQQQQHQLVQGKAVVPPSQPKFQTCPNSPACLLPRLCCQQHLCMAGPPADFHRYPGWPGWLQRA